MQGCFLTYHALYVGELRDATSCPLPPRMTDAQEALIEERVTRALERDGADGGAGGRRARAPTLRFIHVQDARGRLGGERRRTAWMNKLMDGAHVAGRTRKTASRL